MEEIKEDNSNWRENFYVRFAAFIFTGVLGPVSMGMIIYSMASGLFGATPNLVPGFFGVILVTAICTFTAYLAIGLDKAVPIGILAPVVGLFAAMFPMSFTNSNNVYLAALIGVMGGALLLLVFAYQGHRDNGWIGIIFALAINFLFAFLFSSEKPFDENSSYIAFLTIFLSAIASGNLYLLSYLTQNIKHWKRKGIVVGVGVTLLIFGVIANGSGLWMTKSVNLIDFEQMESIENIYFINESLHTPINISASEKKEVLKQLKLLKSVDEKSLNTKEPDIDLVIEYTEENPNLRPQRISISIFTKEKILMINFAQNQLTKRFYKIDDNLMSKINSWWVSYNNSPQAPIPGRPTGSFYRPAWLNDNQLAYFFAPYKSNDNKRLIMAYDYNVDQSKEYAKIPGRRLDNAWAMPERRFVIYDDSETYLYDLSRTEKPISSDTANIYYGQENFGLGTNVVAYVAFETNKKGSPDWYLKYQSFNGDKGKALLSNSGYVNSSQIYVSPYDNRALIEIYQNGEKTYRILNLNYTKDVNGNWQSLNNLQNIVAVRFIDKDKAYIIQGQNGTLGFTFTEYNFLNQKGKLLGTIDTDEINHAAISPKGQVFLSNFKTWLWEPKKGFTLVENQFDVEEISWSPDGKKVAYCLKHDQPGVKIKIYDLATGQIRYVK